MPLRWSLNWLSEQPWFGYCVLVLMFLEACYRVPAILNVLLSIYDRIRKSKKLANKIFEVIEVVNSTMKFINSTMQLINETHRNLYKAGHED